MTSEGSSLVGSNGIYKARKVRGLKCGLVGSFDFDAKRTSLHYTNFLGQEINFRCPALDFLSQAGPPHGAPMFGCNLEVSGFILTHNMIAWYRGPKTLDALPLILWVTLQPINEGRCVNFFSTNVNFLANAKKWRAGHLKFLVRLKKFWRIFKNARFYLT